MGDGAAVARNGGSNGARPGQLLKEARIRNGWTLADVSARTGLPIPTLSKLENGRTTFTYDKLMLLSQGMGIDITQLLSSDASGPPPTQSAGRRSIARKGEGARVEFGTYSFDVLAADLLQKRFVPMVGDITARSLDEFGEMIRHPGEEFLYVLEGTLELHSDTYAPVRLEKGDSIFFDSEMAHAYIAVGAKRCTILSICSEPRD